VIDLPEDFSVDFFNQIPESNSQADSLDHSFKFYLSVSASAARHPSTASPHAKNAHQSPFLVVSQLPFLA
jgi:hypothetical protein